MKKTASRSTFLNSKTSLTLCLLMIFLPLKTRALEGDALNIKLLKGNRAPWTGVLAPEDEFRYLVEQAHISDYLQNKVIDLSTKNINCAQTSSDVSGYFMSGVVGFSIATILAAIVYAPK